MLRSRVCDERCFSLQRQGRLGTFSPVNGEEAAVVGSAWALEPGARLDRAPVPRAAGDAALRLPADPGACSTTRASPAGSRMDADANVLPFQISLAAQIPHAVGLAWGLRHPGPRRRRRHVLRRRRLVGGRRARGAEPRRRAPRAGRLRAQEQRLGDLDAGAQADGGGELRRAGGRLRHRRRAGRRQRPLRDARRLLAGGRAGAGGGGADAHRGPHLPHGPAQHLRRPDALRRSGRARGAAAPSTRSSACAAT